MPVPKANIGRYGSVPPQILAVNDLNHNRILEKKVEVGWQAVDFSFGEFFLLKKGGIEFSFEHFRQIFPHIYRTVPIKNILLQAWRLLVFLIPACGNFDENVKIIFAEKPKNCWRLFSVKNSWDFFIFQMEKTFLGGEQKFLCFWENDLGKSKT